MSGSNYITSEGIARLEKELHNLKVSRREEIAEDIQKSKGIGGIVDNAAYEDAKNEQAFIEGRIRTLENMLNTAILISKPLDDTARVGSTVTVHQINGTEKNYVIVGSPESDPSVGKISNVSPIGKALIGKRVGDKTTISAPAGEIELEITKIK